ncbi:MAG: O-antigen ligase family protein [Bacillota bacterium]
MQKIIIIFLVWVALIPLFITPFVSDFSYYRESFGDEYILKRADKIYKPKLEFLYVVSALLMVLGLLKFKTKDLEGDVTFIPLLIFFGLLILSTVFSIKFNTSLYGRMNRWEGLITFACYFTLFFSGALFVERKKELKNILLFLLFSASLISIYGLLQYYGLDFIEWLPPRNNWGKRAFATLGNPDFAGAYILLFLPGSIVMYLFSKTRKKIVCFGFLSVLFYSMLIATSTRSSWLTFIVVLPLIIYFCHKKGILYKNKFKLIVLLVIFLLVFGFLNLRYDGYQYRRLSSIFIDVNTVATGEGEEVQRAGSNRMLIYQQSLPLLFKNPLLGSGLDTFDKVFPQETYREIVGTRGLVDKAHNEYLQLGVTAGLPALVAYLVFLFSLLQKGWKNWQQDNTGLRAALFVSFLAYIIQAFFNISVVSVAPVFWTIMGLNVAADKVLIKSGRGGRPGE